MLEYVLLDVFNQRVEGKLFKRIRRGDYFLNPNLAQRVKDEWIDIYRHAGLDLIVAIAQAKNNNGEFQRIIQMLTKRYPEQSQKGGVNAGCQGDIDT